MPTSPLKLLGTIESSSANEQIAEMASAIQQGHWLFPRSSLGPQSAVTMAATSGAAGINQITNCCVASLIVTNRNYSLGDWLKVPIVGVPLAALRSGTRPAGVSNGKCCVS